MSRRNRFHSIVLSVALAVSACGCAAPARLVATRTPESRPASVIATSQATASVADPAYPADLPKEHDPNSPEQRERTQALETVFMASVLIVGLILVLGNLH